MYLRYINVNNNILNILLYLKDDFSFQKAVFLPYDFIFLLLVQFLILQFSIYIGIQYE